MQDLTTDLRQAQYNYQSLNTFFTALKDLTLCEGKETENSPLEIFLNLPYLQDIFNLAALTSLKIKYFKGVNHFLLI